MSDSWIGHNMPVLDGEVEVLDLSAELEADKQGE